MISELTYLGAPEWIMMIVISIVALSSLIKAVQAIWGWAAPKLFGIQTKMQKKKDIENVILHNQEEIQTLKKKQEDDHFFSKEGDMKLASEIRDLKQCVDDINSTVFSMRIDAMRTTILDFASAVGSGRVYSKEQYDVILQLYKDYEDLLNKNNMTNGVVTISAHIIEEQYAWNITHGGFLENRWNSLVEDRKNEEEKV